MAEMVIINKTLKDEGLKIGDKVCYKPNQEYEFNIDGEKLWRMFDHCITLVL